MKKRALALLLVICTLFQLLPVTASAASVLSSGKCGDNATWKLTSDGTLTISGTGAMKDYDHADYTPWCDDRNTITSIVIGKGITHIGESAFRWTNASSVTIPNSVTSIGELAFDGCWYLSNVTIPNSVETIGDSAFNGCNDMTSLSLGSGVTTIGTYAFSSTSLPSVTIPESVSSIGTGVFYNCHQLQKINVSSKNAYYCNDSRGVLFNKDKTTLHTAPGAISGSYAIPDSVMFIEKDAFANCDNLTSLTVPADIGVVGENAFMYCDSLEEIVFHGDAPVFAENAFSGTTTTVYYPDYVTTWTTDVMQDYGGTVTWEAGLRQLSWKNDPRVYTVTVGSATTNMTCATLISGAKVTLTKVNASNNVLHEEQEKTDKQGKVQFDTMLVKPEYKRLWIEKSGYQTIETVINYVRNDGSVYFMEKENKDKPYVTCSVVSYSDGGTRYADLRYEPLGMAQGTTKKITTMFKGDWNGHGAGSFVLQQELPDQKACKVLRIQSNGKLTFAPGEKFKAGYPIYLYMVAKDGTKSDPVRVDLRIYESDAMLGDVAGPGTMKWLTDQKLTSGNKVFELLQAQPSISTELLPVSVEVEDKKDYFEFEIVIGEVSLWEDNKPVGKNSAEAKRIKDYIKQATQSKPDKTIASKFNATKVRSIVTGEVNAGGYVIAKLDKKTQKFTSVDSGILVDASGKFTMGRTWVTPVGIPIFLEFFAEVSGKVYGSLTKAQLQSAISGWNGSVPMLILPVPAYDGDRSELNLPAIGLEGGVGLRSLMTVGVGGELKHKVKLPLKNGTVLQGFVTSNLFTHVKLMHIVDQKYKFGESSKPIYEWTTGNRSLTLYSSGQADALSDSDEGFQLVSRDYLNETSEWVGTPVNILNDGNALAPLQTGVMSDVIPQIHTVGDRQIMLFLRDSGARSIGNHTQLVYSVLENGTWSEPVPVWESETADIYFDSAVEDGKLVVAWQKSDTVLDETDPVELLNAMAASSEIAYAQWDNENNCFVNQQFLTENDQMDLMASVAMDGGDAVVVWATTGTDVLGGTGDYTLNQIRVENGVKGTAEELCTTDKYIVEVAAGVTDDGVQAAWITSENDGTSDLYRFADGAPEMVAEEGNFAGLSFHKDSFMVQNNGALYSFAPATGEMAQLLGEDMAVSSSYQYVRNGETESIVWYRSGETGNLMASVYSDGAWQAPVVLLDEITDNIAFMDVAVNAYGQYLVVANTADFTENGAENTALKFTCITPAKELELVGASVYDADWENKTQEINLLLENTGFFPISKVTVEVTAGDTDCLRDTISVDLQSGESCEITETLDITGIESLVDAVVRVSAEGDADETNNTDVVTLGYADVSLEVDPMIYGDYEIFVLKAENASNTDANVTLTVREDDAEGAVLETIDLGVVTAEESVQYWYSVDASAIDFGDSDHKTYYFSISTDVADLSDLDDSCLGTVEKPAGDGILPDDVEIEEIVVVEPESVEILNDDIVISGVESEGVQLKAQVTPDGETGVDWYAEDSSIVHVTSEGFVIPLNPGTTTVTAAVSEEIFDTITVTVKAIAHEHTEEIVEGIEATCTENGLTDGCICSVCLETLTEHRVIPASGHSISGDPTFDWAEDYSTCHAVRSCGTCGESVAIACEITSTTTPATENQAGATVYTATVELDGKTYTDTKTVEIPATGHVKHITTLVPATEADCTDPGNIAYYTCSGCDVWFADADATEAIEDHNSVIVPALGHTEEIVPGKDATCTEPGLTDGIKCTVCGEILTEQEEIPALGHTEETVPGKDATCTEPGLTDGTKCTVCGEVLTEQEEIPALGHTEETIPGKDATCTESGLTEGTKCTVCGEVLTEQEEIPALGHTEETIPGKEATCTESGLTDGVKCSVCGEVLVEQQEIPAPGHAYESVVTAPTCTAQGFTTHTCPACGDSYVDSYVDATGHSYSGVSVFAWDENYETCTAGFVCETCGGQFKENCEVTSHSEDATCTEPGTVTYTATVTVNGVTYTDEKTVENAALGHLEGEAVRENEVPATCTTEGSYEEVVSCERCGSEISRRTVTVEKLPHTEETVPGYDATCTDSGLTEGTKCSVCGEILTEQEEIPALGHSYENGICTVCGEEDPDYEEPVEPSDPEESDPTEPGDCEKPDNSYISTFRKIIKKIVKKYIEIVKPFFPWLGHK